MSRISYSPELLRGHVRPSTPQLVYKRQQLQHLARWAAKKRWRVRRWFWEFGTLQRRYVHIHRVLYFFRNPKQAKKH
jgi:hypothetical protein